MPEDAPPAADERAPARTPDQILLLVGQLLEMARGTTAAIKGISDEGRRQAAVLLELVQTTETLESRVDDLDALVLNGAPRYQQSLAFRVAALEDATARDRQALAEVRAAQDQANQARDRAIGAGTTLRYAAIVLFQLITLLVAVYAVLRGI